jgi:cellulose biosynthesis protein BcsQ
MLKIAITNEKGGTGKSTIACLLVEYLNHLKKKVQLIDTDPIQTSQTWVNNCKQEGRQVSTASADYQVIDTAGSSGSALSWLAQADLILVPFRPHYADLQTTTTWFTSLKPDWQAKITFIPNHWQNTKEQREGLAQIKEIIGEEKHGRITNPLTNRPALYGTLLNGSKINFFARKNLPSEIKELFKEILTNYEKIN